MSIVKRLCAALALVCLLVPTLLVGSSFASAATGSGGSGSYDRSLSSADCDLLGRTYVKREGCSRKKCVRGASLYRKVYGAEACQLRGQGAYGFVSTIDFRVCSALGRRWIREVNYCASYPDRSATAVYDAPQCVGPRSVYVQNTEADGYYDECVTPQRASELVEYARTDGTDLAVEASQRSRVQCLYRPGQVYVDGVCVADPGPRPAKGGVLMVGDSLTWRGTDELGRLRPDLTLDGEPARQISELPGRLAYYVSGHGQPTGLIVAMGAVPAPKSFGKSDLARVVRSLPRTTKVMFVMPYAALPSGKASPRTTKIGGWMRSIAKQRGRSCVVDWPAYVRAKPGLLQDGVHLKNNLEGTWARLISQQWGRC
jgi:hypothetical protein